MIKLRIDVDYPYPSRNKSFFYTALGIKPSKDYLKNSKIIARMINESLKEVKATWFFTPATTPDRELLSLLNNDRHEVALHIVNNPYSEWKNLERITGKKMRYYTVHGTERLLARIMWRRWTTRSPRIPPEFPLISFYQFPTKHLDAICYSTSTNKAVKIAQSTIREDQVLHFHPIWLFQKGKINHRGPFYNTLRKILNVDNDVETIAYRKKIFFTIAKNSEEYEKDVVPTEEFLTKIRERGVDVFTFLERRWVHTLSQPTSWIKRNDNIALLHITSYDDWWKNIGKKTRNMIRKAEKSGIKTRIAEPDEKLAEGMWKIYNETPIRQDRAFPHYGVSLDAITKGLHSPTRNMTYVGAFLQNELAGFIQLLHGDNIAIVSQILSLQKHWDKAVNNALVAKTVEVCASNHEEWLMYARMGNHPSLDNFKQSNGFVKFQLTRYYIPLTRKGRVALKLGLHIEMKDALPQRIKYPLIPLYNLISRTKVRIRLRLKT
ncbi:MAG: hypothetical protein ABSB28_03755 [Candidatus Bathyarchaeia archaeon]